MSFWSFFFFLVDSMGWPQSYNETFTAEARMIENTGEPESPQVQKARRKLEAQLVEERKKVTPEMLSKMVREIQHYIQRHASVRKSLKNKDITLFDENRNAAKIISPHILALRSQIIEGKTPSVKPRSLRGRVKRKI